MSIKTFRYLQISLNRIYFFLKVVVANVVLKIINIKRDGIKTILIYVLYKIYLSAIYKSTNTIALTTNKIPTKQETTNQEIYQSQRKGKRFKYTDCTFIKT